MEFSIKAGWPKIRRLRFDIVWRWLSQFDDFFERGYSETQVGRALCAFSRIVEFSNTDEPIHLLWSLLGIECLYVQGNIAILEQVKEKTKLILGEQSAFKKALGQMYDFRSKFVHGALNIPRIGTDYHKKYSGELIESISVAAAVFLATLQELVRKDWKELAFVYTPKPALK
jgi:hypothetical protein